MLKQNKTNRIFYFIFILIIIGTVLFCTRYLVLHLSQSVTFNIPNEYRDFSLMRIVQIFLDGHNPYTLDFQTNINSPELFQYTLLTTLVATLFTPLFGGDILLTFYFLSIFYITITTLLLCRLAKKLIPTLSYYWYLVILIQTFCLFSMFFASRPAITFRPDAIGILILTLLYFILYDKKQYVFLVALLSVLLFFTKQFFVIIAIPIIIYYLLSEKKLAIKYMIYCISLGLLSLVIIQLIFPLYWTNTIYSQFLSAGTVGTVLDAIKNLALYVVKAESVVVLLFLLFALGLFLEMRRSSSKITWLIEKSKENQYITFLVSSILVYGIFLLWLAQNKSDGFKYINALLLTPLLLLSIYYVNNIMVHLFKKNQGTIITMAIAMLLAVTPLPAFNWNVYSESEINEWERLSALCDQYEVTELFLSPMPSSYLLEREHAIYEAYYDDGHLQYFEYPAITNFDTIFAGVAEERELIANFKNEISQKILSSEFELVIIPTDYWLIDENLLATNYTNSEQLNLTAGCNSSTVQVWTRKSQ